MKREDGFDRIEIIAKMHGQRLHAGFDSELFCIRLYNPRWPHTPEEYTLEMSVDVERLRLEIIFSQPGVPRAETQKTTDQEGTNLFQKSETFTAAQAAAREECARPPKNRQ